MRAFRRTSLVLVAALAAAARAGPESERIRDLAAQLASADVAARNGAQWQLLDLLGEARNESEAKRRATETILAIGRLARDARLGIDAKFFSDQVKHVKSVRARKWVDHFLAGEEDVVYLAGTIPNRFKGAACVNEIAVGVGNAIAAFIQGTEQARLQARGIAVPEGMVLVPAGEFVMGSSAREVDACIEAMEGSEGWAKYPHWRERDVESYRSEVPRRIASTGAFFLDRTELTNRTYKDFCDATGFEPPTKKHLEIGQGNYPFFDVFAWKGDPPTFRKIHTEHPFIFANLARGQAFGAWAGKRLPNETEWEKAARGIDGRVWPWGCRFETERAQTPERLGPGPGYLSHYLPVDSLPEGRSPWGCVQIAGNAWEVTMPSPEAGGDDGAETTARRRLEGVAASRGGDAAHSVSHGGTNSRTARRSVWERDIPSASYATFRFAADVDDG